MLVTPGIEVERITLDIEPCNCGLEGLKIVQLSDLHIRRFGARERKIVRLVNREAPDFIFITGDLIVGFSNQYSACVRTLGEMRARRGVFAVLGNADHTFKPRRFQDDFLKALEDIRVTVLSNRNVRLSYGERNFYLIGVDDPFYHYDNFDEAVKGVCFNHPTILLAHSPDILLPRGDALAVNLIDSDKKEDFFKTWSWAESTYFGPERGDVYFERDGTQTVRIQSRQDGVFVDTIILNPYPELDDALNFRRFGRIDEFLRAGSIPERYGDLIAIPAGAVQEERMHGKWKKAGDSGALSGIRLDDLPARRGWRYQPLVDPADYFEADFSARSGVRYHLWMRLKAFNGSPLSDSVYVQFSDAVDGGGNVRYRIGMAAHTKARLNDVDVILTGHTHGGQIRIPFYGPIETMTSIGKRYSGGLYRLKKSLLYVSRGVGYSILPVRVLCPAEVTVFGFQPRRPRADKEARAFQ